MKREFISSGNEVLPPIEYKKRLDLLYQCYRIVNQFNNPFTQRLEEKFAEKQMSAKFKLFMYYVIHTEAVNSLLVAFVGDSWDKAYNCFNETGLKHLAIRPSTHFPVPKYINSCVEGDLDALLDMEAKRLYPHDDIAAMQPLYTACYAIAPNRYEFENDIVDLEVLPPVMCGGLNVVHRTTKTAKKAGCCIHFLDFDLGFEYMESCWILFQWN